MASAVVQGLLSPALQDRIQSLQADIEAGRLTTAQVRTQRASISANPISWMYCT
jgi:hypothetical protein